MLIFFETTKWFTERSMDNRGSKYQLYEQSSYLHYCEST